MTQTTQTTQEPEAAPPLGGDERGEWAIVEIMGHRKHAGLTFEVERFGTKMLRIDVPKDGDPGAHGWETVFYGGPSIFSFSLCSQETALAYNRPYRRPSVYQLEPPDAETGIPPYDGDDDDDNDGDGGL